MSSSYAALTPVASPLQPENNQGYLHTNPEHLATFAAAWERGKEMQIPHVSLCFSHTTEDLAYRLLGKRSQQGSCGSVCLSAASLQWPEPSRWKIDWSSGVTMVVAVPPLSASLALWRAGQSFPGGYSKASVSTSTGTACCDRTHSLPVSVEHRLLWLWFL